MWHYILLALVSIASGYKVLNLYFWHDDYAVLYMARTGECIISWPYKSYCYIFPFLETFFNFNPILYYGLGLLLFIISVFVLYHFISSYLGKHKAFWGALIYATIWVGQGAFLEAYSIVTTFLSLNLFLLSLFSLKRTIDSRFHHKWLTFYLLTYSLSVIVLHARSATYFISPLVILFLYRGKKILNPALLGMLTLLMHYVLYFKLPYQLQTQSNTSTTLKYFTDINVINFSKEFILTLASISTPDWLPQSIVSLGPWIVIITTVIMIIQILRKTKDYKHIIIAVSLLGSLYIPYGLKSTSALWSEHRYIIFLMPGSTLLWAIYANHKIVRYVTLILVIISIYQTNKFFNEYVDMSGERQTFYNQLVDQLELQDGDILFINYPKETENKFVDFFRVGYLASEASIATHFKRDYKSFSLITDSTQFTRLVNKENINKLKVFKYYNGVLQNRTGELPVLNEKQFNPIIPFSVYISLSSTVIDPVGVNSDPLVVKVDDLQLVELLANSLAIKSQAEISSPDTSEEVLGEYLSDNSIHTIWYPNRQGWYKNATSDINIKFESKQKVGGLLFYRQGKVNKVTELEVKSGGVNLPIQSITSTDDRSIVILKDIVDVLDMQLKITATSDEDMPVIEEIYFLSNNSDDFQLFNQFQKISYNTKNEQEEIVWKKYLQYGSSVCIDLYSADKIIDTKCNVVVSDGKIRDYTFRFGSHNPEIVYYELNSDEAIKTNIKSIKVSFF